MKVLFLSIDNYLCPQFETELELISNHIEKGDDVYVLSCYGECKSCDINPKNDKIVCLVCRNRFNDGMCSLNSSKIKIIRLKRKVSSENLKLLPQEFKNIEELKEFELFGVDFGAAVASSLISSLREYKLDTLLHKERIYKTLYSALLVYESVFKELQRINPDVFYFWNGRFALVRPAVRACEKLGVAFCSYDMNLLYYVKYKNFLPHDLPKMRKNILQTWDDSSLSLEKKIQQAEVWFNDTRYGKGTFVDYQKKENLPISFDTKKRNVVFFNSSIDEMETFPKWKKKLVYKDEIDALVKIVVSFKTKKDMQFYLRVHPNLKGLDNTQMRNLRKLDSLGCGNLEIIWPEERICSYALLEACEKNITFGSTMGVESCFWGKRSILLGDAFYEDLDCCYIPRAHEEVLDMICADLSPKEKLGALKYGYWNSSRKFFFDKFNNKDSTFCGMRIGAKWSFENRVFLKLYNGMRFVKRLWFLKNKE